MPQRHTPLRLRAEDAEDLQIISAALQDAVARLGDFEFSSKQNAFTIAVNRFVWEAGGRARRVRAGLQLAGVKAAQAHRLRQGADDAVVNLLSVSFEPGAEAPAGEIVLTFSGGGALRLEVECVEAILVDLSEPWPAAGRPEHEGDEA